MLPGPVGTSIGVRAWVSAVPIVEMVYAREVHLKVELAVRAVVEGVEAMQAAVAGEEVVEVVAVVEAVVRKHIGMTSQNAVTYIKESCSRLTPTRPM